MSILTYIKAGVGALVVALVLGLWLWGQHLETSLANQVAATQTAKAAVASCQSANANTASQEAQTALAFKQGELTASNQAIAQFSASVQASDTAASSINLQIAQSINQPGYDGPVALVLINAGNMMRGANP